MESMPDAAETGARPKVEPGPERSITIVVEVNGRNVPVRFNSSRVTGREIREGAGVPATDDLTRLERGRPSGGNIGLTDQVEIRNGDRFIALPAGTVS